MNQEHQTHHREFPSWYETNSFLWDHLLKAKGELEAMRDSFSLGSEIGFAHISLGFSGTPAFVAEISLAAGIPTHHVMRQMVKPEPIRGDCKLVTIALPEEQYEADPRLTIAFFQNKKVVIGIIAHELAHCVVEIESGISEAIKYVLNMVNHPTENAYYQAQTDLLACVYGYHEEIFEALTAWLNLIKQTKTGNRKEINEIRFRIKAVKQFRRI